MAAEVLVSGPLYLEDIFVGQRFVTASHPLTVHEVKAFARAYDPQPFHLDEQAGKESFFHGLVASGELSWPKAARPGDELRVESEVLEVRPSRSKPERGFVTLKSETKNQQNEVVQSFTVKLLVWRRPEYGF